MFGLKRPRCLSWDSVVYNNADCCSKQTRLLFQGSRLLSIRKQTVVFHKLYFCLWGSRLLHLGSRLFNNIFVVFYLFHWSQCFVVFCKWTEGREFLLLLPQCHSLTVFFLKWQQQKTKVFQSHVWIFSILLLQSPPVPLLELAPPIPGGDLIRKSSHFPTNIDGIYQYRSFS